MTITRERCSQLSPLLETLLAYLNTQSLLLILDNCEHVVADAAKIGSAFLAGCPQVRILTTSRESLRILEEHVYRIASLSLPSPQDAHRLTAVTAQEHAAIALFAERARAACDSFALTDENVATITEICRRLDGIPLAIELAALRVGSWPLERIAKRLDQRFTLLTGGDRSAPARHQTMRALIDWSYDLLSPQEQQLLRSVSVFPSTWTLDSAAAVFDAAASDSERTAALLSSLVDKSLVTVERTGDTLRYCLPESIRAYASEKSPYER
jgi:non-specific serine/threonine protein kinase